MLEIFQTADPYLRTLWYIATPVTVIFIIQVIMTFVGADASDGIDADFDSNLHHTDAPFQLFSLRNLINFLLGFSWAGISFFQIIENKILLTGFSFLVGTGMVALFFYVIRQVRKLSEDNSFQLQHAVNKSATVYIPIPAQRSGSGKVQLSVNGAIHELVALTDQEKLESGTMVRVVSILNDQVLLVEKL